MGWFLEPEGFYRLPLCRPLMSPEFLEHEESRRLLCAQLCDRWDEIIVAVQNENKAHGWEVLRGCCIFDETERESCASVGGKVIVEEVNCAVFVDRNVFKVCVGVGNRCINCRLALRVKTKCLCEAAVFSSKDSSIWK